MTLEHLLQSGARSSPCADRRRGHIQHGRRHRRPAATARDKGQAQIWLMLDEPIRSAFWARQARPAEFQGVDPSRSISSSARCRRRWRLAAAMFAQEAGDRLVPLHAAGLRLQRRLSPVILARPARRCGSCKRNLANKQTRKTPSFSAIPLMPRAFHRSGDWPGVVPILFQDSVETMWASQHLLEQGFYVRRSCRSAAEGQPRLRSLFPHQRRPRFSA